MNTLQTLSAACLATLTTPLFAADINVPVDFPTIQGAIVAASNGDVICVAPGAYVESINYLGKAITVRPTQNGDVVTLATASIGLSAVTFASGEGANSVLDGIRLVGSSTEDVNGAAMSILSASPTIQNCLFLDNAAGTDVLLSVHGGAVFVDNSTAADVTFDNCTFINNQTRGRGGAVHLRHSHATFDDCLFKLNLADGSGGALRLEDNSFADIARSRFDANHTLNRGGGVSVEGFGSASLQSSVVVKNTSGSFGGGIHVDMQASIELEGCTIADNEALTSGGSSNTGGGLYANNAPTVTVHNTILWGNITTTGPQAYVIANSFPSVLDVSYSTLQNGPTGFIAFGSMLTQNIGLGIQGQNPLFIDAPNGDYHLQGFSLVTGAISPCINTGDPATTAPNCELDIDSEPRVSFIVDQGADERGPLTVTPNSLGIAGGTVSFDLFAPTNANQTYIILGSISGTKPGFTTSNGVHVPINVDAYTTLTLSGSVGSNFLGTLDGLGQFPVTPTLTLPSNPAQPTIGPQLIGLQFDHSVVTLNAGVIVAASNTASFRIDLF